MAIGLLLGHLIREVTRGQAVLMLALVSAMRRESAARLRISALDGQVARLDQEAEAAYRVKDAFLATLSHELRTPLNATLGWVQLLRRRLDSPSERAHALEVIERNTRAQAQVVADLLDVSRLTTGQIRLSCEPIPLDQVVREASESLQSAATAKRLAVHVDSQAGGAVVFGDAARLRQVFWNLLGNAIKFTPRGGWIDVVVRRSGSAVEVSVADSGVGIAPDLLPHLFRRFQQGDSSTTRRFGGLGLGLALVRHLVELHGGTVRAHSRGLDQGATFVVSLPIDELAEARST